MCGMLGEHEREEGREGKKKGDTEEGCGRGLVGGKLWGRGEPGVCNGEMAESLLGGLFGPLLPDSLLTHGEAGTQQRGCCWFFSCSLWSWRLP